MFRRCGLSRIRCSTGACRVKVVRVLRVSPRVLPAPRVLPPWALQLVAWMLPRVPLMPQVLRALLPAPRALRVLTHARRAR